MGTDKHLALTVILSVSHFNLENLYFKPVGEGEFRLPVYLPSNKIKVYRLETIEIKGGSLIHTKTEVINMAIKTGITGQGIYLTHTLMHDYTLLHIYYTRGRLVSG